MARTPTQRTDEGVHLLVNGVDYAGWKSARITRGIETIAGKFELSVSDRWAGQAKPWPIRQGDECTVKIDSTPLITGYVDRRSLSFGPEAHSVSVEGRDKAGALVDCSAGAPAGNDAALAALAATGFVSAGARVVLGPWEFSSLPLLKFAQRIADPFGIKVTLDPIVAGELATPVPKMTIDPGESAFEALDRACRFAGALPVSDGLGGVVLTRAGTRRTATALVEGENILSGSAEYDSAGRYRRVVVLGQRQGTDGDYGLGAAGTRGDAIDAGVSRADRTLITRADVAVTNKQAKTRAEWEATVRAGRAASVTITVQGWTQGDGSLWPVNALVDVHSPLLELDTELLITQAEFSLDESGTITRLSLRRPDAFAPEPVVKPTGHTWDEIRHGA